MTRHEWALKHGVSLSALRELEILEGTYTLPTPPDPGHGKTEAWVQSVVRLEASQKGVKLFRNNVGALKDSTGRVVRYGLANDSAHVNKVIKSGDLIGWRPVVIEPRHVGFRVALFTSREIKAPDWQYDPRDEHTAAQMAWNNLVNADGGDARFATGEGTL